MARVVFVVIALVLVGADSPGPPEVRLPKEVAGQPGDFIRVPADTRGSIVRWYALDPGLAVFPGELLKDTRTAVVIARANGRYRLLAYTASGDQPSHPALCLVVVGDSPVPPGPDPPDPTPPDDPLLVQLQAIYSADVTADKHKLVRSLSALYGTAGPIIDDPAVKTAGQLFALLRKASAALLPGDALPALRERLATELKTVLPTAAATPLTAEHRGAAKAMFARLAKLLGALK